MTLERRNPLPAGRYWVDTFRFENDDQPARFDGWARANAALGLVKVVTTETDTQSDPERVWYLFEVTPKASMPELPLWVGIGLPTIAGPEIQSSDDTVSKPDVGVSDVPLWAVGLILGGAALLAWQLRTLFGGQSK